MGAAASLTLSKMVCTSADVILIAKACPRQAAPVGAVKNNVSVLNAPFEGVTSKSEAVLGSVVGSKAVVPGSREQG